MTMNPSDPNPSDSAFWSEFPDVDLTKQVNQTLPGSAGGPIQAVKYAVVTALREAIRGTSLRRPDGNELYVDLEYPLKEEYYPGIWVQFSISKWQRAGLAHETVTQVNGDWATIQVFSYWGRVTLSIVGLKNKDRDQLSDAVLMMLSFSRTPQVVITKQQEDTKQYRHFLTSLDENPYVSITPNTDIIVCGGQGVDVGVPWQPDVLAYTDSYAFDVHGQVPMQFTHDGIYTLADFQITATALNGIPDDMAPVAPLPTNIGRGTMPWVTYRMG